jgi:hypothetical protein
LNLRKEQSLFAIDVAKLILWASEHGYEVTGGEWWRTPEMAAIYADTGLGIKESLHIKRLAIDLNLFKDGVYLPASEAHKPLGEYWKSLSPYNRWGGDFVNYKGVPKPDGNHYERRLELE